MKKKFLRIFNNEKGFTLIEMIIVLLVISVLLIITLPNVSKQSNDINAKGCDAFVSMVQGQVESFRMNENTIPASLDDLVSKGYLNENETSCPGGQGVQVDRTGKVTVVALP